MVSFFNFKNVEKFDVALLHSIDTITGCTTADHCEQNFDYALVLTHVDLQSKAMQRAYIGLSAHSFIGSTLKYLLVRFNCSIAFSHRFTFDLQRIVYV